MHKHDIHFHFIKGFTTYNLEHNHAYSGRSDYAYNFPQHRHYYSIYTTFDSGHSHLIYGYTGPAIYLPNGRHYHLFYGRTTVDGSTPHYHEYQGITSF